MKHHGDSLLMLAVCSAGMAIGLAWDLRTTLPETIDSMCGSDSSPMDILQLHIRLLPVAHVLMLAGAVAVILANVAAHVRTSNAAVVLCRRLVACAAMSAGMILAESFGPTAARQAGMTWNIVTMTTAMQMGMMLGAAVHLRLPPAKFETAKRHRTRAEAARG